MSRNRRYFMMLLLTGLVALPQTVRAADIAVAKVNGAVITERNLDEAMEQLMPRTFFHGTSDPQRRAEYREKALEALIKQELQYQDALARGIKADSGQVKEQLKQVRDSFKTSREYHYWLERTRITEGQLKERIEKRLIVRTAVKRISEESARMEEKAVQAYYQDHRDKFQEPESARVRVISTKDAKKADAILGKLRAGADFSALAMELSEDDYRAKGGDIGVIKRGMVYPLLEEKAFSLQPGEISGIIPSEGVLYIIKVEERRPGRSIPYEEVSDSLKKDLEQKRRDDLVEQWVSGLRSKAEIVVEQGALDK